MIDLRTRLVPVLALALAGCVMCNDFPQIAVDVEVIDERGAPIDDAEIACSRDGGPFQDWCNGPPGRYTVRVTRGDQVVEREVDVGLSGDPACEQPETEHVTIVLPEPDQSAP